MNDSQAKTVLITGAAGSLGAALTQGCVDEGCNTIMLDCDQRGLEQVYDRVAGKGGAEPVLFPLDLATAGPEQYEAMVDAIADQFGSLDALVHCAVKFESLTPLEHFPPSEWLMHIQVNLNAAWLLSVHCLPLLRAADAGRLCFMLEDLQKVQGALWGPYGVSKHGLKALASQFAAELKNTPVQVLAFDPGPIRSPLRSRAYHAEGPGAQPQPDAAAGQIIDYLLGRRKSDDYFIELKPG